MRTAAILLGAVLLSSLSVQTSQAQIAWQPKLRDAHALAEKQGKLMLLHFYSDNCVFCDRLEAGAFQSSSVAQSINQNFVPVKIHGTKNPELAKRFQVTKYPTDVIVTTNGKALSHSVSPQDPGRYIAMLSRAQLSFSKTKTMLASGKQPAVRPPAESATLTPTLPDTTNPTANGFNLPGNSVAQSPAAQPNTMGDSLPVQIPAPGQPQTASSNSAAIASATPNPPTVVAEPSSARGNQFMLPSGRTGVTASLTGARTEGMSLSGAAITAEPETNDQPSASLPAESSKPELAIQGYCAVSVVDQGQWVEGQPELGVVHLGKLYLFSSKDAMEKFLADPVPFTPMLNEIDVVRFFEEKKIVPGRREWGVIDPIHNRMFFFADEAAMLHFESSFERYLEAAIEVMDHAIAEANPGV